MPGQSVDQLKSSFRGELIQPADAAYDSARKVYNGMIDKRPQLIARCVDVADVMAAVQFGRENQMLTAIRGGGHNGAGLGTCDDGLVIDLSPMKGIRVDPAARTVRVGAGCVWGDVDHATHAFGMATPCGFVSTTGVAGLTLGGGIGYLTRQYGLTIDNLLSVDMVLADGSFVTASADENSDLFWAVRGGGGNFGVVTSFEFRLHPVSTVNCRTHVLAPRAGCGRPRAYRGFIVDAPEDVSGFFAFLVVPPAPMFPEHLHLKKVCGIVWCCTGSAEQTEAATKPMRTLGQPLSIVVGPDAVSGAAEHIRRRFRARPAMVLAGRQLQGIERRSHRAARGARVERSRPCSRPCTSTPSTARLTGWARPTPPTVFARRSSPR